VIDVNRRIIKIGRNIASAISLPEEMQSEALDMFEDIATDPRWTNIRSNKSLMVDCVYEVAKKHDWRVDGKKVTVDSLVLVTKGMFGRGTQPKPHLWRTEFGRLE